MPVAMGGDVADEVETIRFGTEAWELTVPVSYHQRQHVTPPSDTDITEMAILRGYLGDTPTGLIVTVRPKGDWHLRSLIRRSTDPEVFPEGPTDGEPVEVAGAKGARRIVGLGLMEEGYGGMDDEREHWNYTVAAGRRSFVTLMSRSRRDPGIEEEVASVVSTFRVLDA